MSGDAAARSARAAARRTPRPPRDVDDRSAPLEVDLRGAKSTRRCASSISRSIARCWAGCPSWRDSRVGKGVLRALSRSTCGAPSGLRRALGKGGRRRRGVTGVSCGDPMNQTPRIPRWANGRAASAHRRDRAQRRVKRSGEISCVVPFHGGRPIVLRAPDASSSRLRCKWAATFSASSRDGECGSSSCRAAEPPRGIPVPDAGRRRGRAAADRCSSGDRGVRAVPCGRFDGAPACVPDQRGIDRETSARSGRGRATGWENVVRRLQGGFREILVQSGSRAGIRGAVACSPVPQSAIVPRSRRSRRARLRRARVEARKTAEVPTPLDAGVPQWVVSCTLSASAAHKSSRRRAILVEGTSTRSRPSAGLRTRSHVGTALTPEPSKAASHDHAVARPTTGRGRAGRVARSLVVLARRGLDGSRGPSAYRPCTWSVGGIPRGGRAQRASTRSVLRAHVCAASRCDRRKGDHPGSGDRTRPLSGRPVADRRAGALFGLIDSCASGRPPKGVQGRPPGPCRGQGPAPGSRTIEVDVLHACCKIASLSPMSRAWTRGLPGSGCAEWRAGVGGRPGLPERRTRPHGAGARAATRRIITARDGARRRAQLRPSDQGFKATGRSIARASTAPEQAQLLERVRRSRGDRELYGRFAI